MLIRILLLLLVTSPFAMPVSAQTGKSKSAPAKKPAGKTSADLVASYTPRVKASLRVRWGDAVTKHMREFAPGTVDVVFKINANGKVTDVAVKTNTSNATFAQFCVQFIRETAFVDPPAGALTDGQVEIPFTFIIQ